jgi:hypothetical protein
MVKINEIYNLNSSPKLTVALPVYNGKEIAWISLESLSEQIDIDFEWELIVYEETHEQSVFPNILNEYIDKLKNINCTRIVFIDNTERVTLVQKWIEIAKNVSSSSECYMLHAADCYSPKRRLKTSYDKIVVEDYDWYDQTKGYFYTFISNRVVLYDYHGLTNLNMSLKTFHMKNLPMAGLKKGIDGYIYNHVVKNCKNIQRQFKRYFDEELYNDSIDTHGYNNISLGREKFFDDKPNIFSVVDLTNNDLGWNNKIKKWVGTGKKVTNPTVELSILIATFDNVEYLDECFNSISKTIKNHNVEILIGIDGCEISKDYLSNKKYGQQFKYFYFDENKGPYLIFNSLSQIAKSDNILFFGSDDIMNHNMIDDIINSLNKYDFVKPSYTNFKDGYNHTENSKMFIGEGVFAIKKNIFHHMNGFEPWMCAADSEFMGRMYKTDFKLGYTRNVNFFHRVHNKGLTSRPDTGMKSKLRGEYVKIAKNKKVLGPLDEFHVLPFKTIDGIEVVKFEKKVSYIKLETTTNKESESTETKDSYSIFDRSKFRPKPKEIVKNQNITPNGGDNTNNFTKKLIEDGKVRKNPLPKQSNPIIRDSSSKI